MAFGTLVCYAIYITCPKSFASNDLRRRWGRPPAGFCQAMAMQAINQAPHRARAIFDSYKASANDQSYFNSIFHFQFSQTTKQTGYHYYLTLYRQGHRHCTVVGCINIVVAKIDVR